MNKEAGFRCEEVHGPNSKDGRVIHASGRASKKHGDSMIHNQKRPGLFVGVVCRTGMS